MEYITMVAKDKNVKISEYSQYVRNLENYIVELKGENDKLKAELETSKRNQSLTERWARGEIEN